MFRCLQVIGLVLAFSYGFVAQGEAISRNVLTCKLCTANDQLLLIHPKLVGENQLAGYALSNELHMIRLSSLANIIDVYEDVKQDSSMRDTSIKKTSSGDTITTKKMIDKLSSNKSGFFPTADLRSIDGLFLGLGYKIRKQGPGEQENGSRQQIAVLKSLNSKAIQIKYRADWKSVFKHTDVTIDGMADIKGNIMRFFGRGNNSVLDKNPPIKPYYHTNFSYYVLEPALKLHLQKAVSLSVGPSFQYFSFRQADNEGRFINTPDAINQFTNLQENKLHAGIFLMFNWNTRNSRLLPQKGINLNLRLQGYEGLNSYSEAYAQIQPEMSFYKSLDAKGNIVLANRTGAGFSIGKPAFYQNLFLGSQGNLLGFEKFRFAGDDVLYNNFEARFAVPDFLKSLLPAKMGIAGFYDVGRVWIKGEHSDKIHQGFGAGLYITLLNKLLVRGNAGFSKEGMKLTATLKQRF